MPLEPVDVSWQVAEDEAMSRVVQRETAAANPSWAHSVHVEVSGLRPDRWYWYQFKAGSEVSPKGRTRTMPRPMQPRRGCASPWRRCRSTKSATTPRTST